MGKLRLTEAQAIQQGKHKATRFQDRSRHLITCTVLLSLILTQPVATCLEKT